MVHRRRAVPRSTTYDDKRLRDEDRGASDGAAIAGDPMSSTHLRDGPRRATRLPARFKDFRLM